MDIDANPIDVSFSTVIVNNKKLRVQHLKQANAANKPMLVFLHEGLGCIELWKDFPLKLALATGYNAIVYDRQGYGGSDALDLPRPMNYLEIEALEFLPELLSTLNISKPILLGHSDGASIALIFGGKYPCSAIISEAAHIYVEDITIEGIKTAKSNPDLQIVKEKLKKYHGSKTEDIFSAWADTWLSDDFRNWNISSLISEINCPLLLIQGLDDEYASPIHVEKIKEATPKATSIDVLLPEKCAHVPHFQAADLVLKTMIAFIKKRVEI
jgi:pimeloyl-ACP methyl ester carboxylesterase